MNKHSSSSFQAFPNKGIALCKVLDNVLVLHVVQLDDQVLVLGIELLVQWRP